MLCFFHHADAGKSRNGKVRTGTLEDTQWEETPDQPVQVKRPIINIILVVINVAVWCVLEIIGDTQDAGLLSLIHI